MSEYRKIPMTILVTDEMLAQAREDFIAIMGMTPEAFQEHMADAMARAFDAAVIDE